MGDFFQFPHINGPALWKEPRSGNDEDATGQAVWHQLRNVIILNQQMRQVQAPKFYELLIRARGAALTENDLALLNQQIKTASGDPRCQQPIIARPAPAQAIHSYAYCSHSAHASSPTALTHLSTHSKSSHRRHTQLFHLPPSPICHGYYL